jgi:isoquinoline 1-oxidoreductase alpha subunit
MTAAALLRDTPQPSAEDVDAAMGGHLCRCGTQQRVRVAVMSLATRPTKEPR